MLSNTLHTCPAEYATTLNLTINGVKIRTTANPKILGLTFDRKLTYAEHTKNAADKAKQSINALKALSSKEWGKHKETILAAYNTIVKPHLEFACTGTDSS
jgi:hypothetical protein